MKKMYLNSAYLTLLALIMLLSACQPASETVEAAVQEVPGAEERLVEMGITLSDPPAPVANYVRAVSTGNLVFLAGHVPVNEDGSYVTGKVGADLTVEQGYEAGKVDRNCYPGFSQAGNRQPKSGNPNRKSNGYGQCNRYFYRSTRSGKRLFGPDGGSLRGKGQTCSRGCGNELIATKRSRRN